jgi:hypothetical protein
MVRGTLLSLHEFQIMQAWTPRDRSRLLPCLPNVGEGLKLIKGVGSRDQIFGVRESGLVVVLARWDCKKFSLRLTLRRVYKYFNQVQAW